MLPLHLILTKLYSSAMLNVITWNAAYSLFPRSTFLKHETFPMREPSPDCMQWHSKHSIRGWRMRVPARSESDPFGKTKWHDEIDDLKGFGIDDEEDDFMLEFGGTTTWKLRLPTAGIKAPPQPDSVLERSRYMVGRPGLEDVVTDWDEFGNTLYYLIKAKPFRSHVFRWEYLLGVEGPSVSALKHVCGRLTLAQMYKLEPEERTRLLPHIRSPGPLSLASDSIKPASW